MDSQWSVTGPAAHPLTQRDCQIAAGYNHLSMGLNLEDGEDVCMFFTSQGRNTFLTVYSHSVTCCTSSIQPAEKVGPVSDTFSRLSVSQ